VTQALRNWACGNATVDEKGKGKEKKNVVGVRCNGVHHCRGGGRRGRKREGIMMQERWLNAWLNFDKQHSHVPQFSPPPGFCPDANFFG
jgi:hypothetical protein